MTSFKYLNACIDMARNRRHRKSFSEMDEDSQCRIYNKLMTFIDEVTWGDSDSFMLFVMNKGKNFFQQCRDEEGLFFFFHIIVNLS
jgi:hypothetical protein